MHIMYGNCDVKKSIESVISIILEQASIRKMSEKNVYFRLDQKYRCMHNIKK